MDFNLQDIWTAGGAAAAAIVVGYIFGVLQSIVPNSIIPSTGVVRNWVIAVLSATVVILAGIDSGRTLSDPNVIGNVFNGVLVFAGIYMAALTAHSGGTVTATRLSSQAKGLA